MQRSTNRHSSKEISSPRKIKGLQQVLNLNKSAPDGPAVAVMNKIVNNIGIYGEEFLRVIAIPAEDDEETDRLAKAVIIAVRFIDTKTSLQIHRHKLRATFGPWLNELEHQYMPQEEELSLRQMYWTIAREIVYARNYIMERGNSAARGDITNGRNRSMIDDKTVMQYDIPIV